MISVSACGSEFVGVLACPWRRLRTPRTGCFFSVSRSAELPLYVARFTLLDVVLPELAKEVLVDALFDSLFRFRRAPTVSTSGA